LENDDTSMSMDANKLKKIEIDLPPPPIQTTARGGSSGVGRKHKGRLKKAKNKKIIKITGLDLLHTQTLLSTSPQGNS
jgi:hypothetical protein